MQHSCIEIEWKEVQDDQLYFIMGVKDLSGTWYITRRSTWEQCSYPVAPRSMTRYIAKAEELVAANRSGHFASLCVDFLAAA
jgi:hypothetical protein